MFFYMLAMTTRDVLKVWVVLLLLGLGVKWICYGETDVEDDPHRAQPEPFGEIKIEIKGQL